MGEGTREKEGWNLTKEAKGCREEEKEGRVLGLLS
jgi:hypothetical protein